MEINNNVPIGQTTASNTKKSSLSIEDFLQIMAAEMKNQNPMGSEGGNGSKTDYISQLAQFTSLEQMSSISESLNLLTTMSQQQYSFSLMGKEVKVYDDDGMITGVVEKVKFQNGHPLIQVNNKSYYLSSLVEVSNSEVEE